MHCDLAKMQQLLTFFALLDFYECFYQLVKLCFLFFFALTRLVKLRLVDVGHDGLVKNFGGLQVEVHYLVQLGHLAILVALELLRGNFIISPQLVFGPELIVRTGVLNI